MGGRGGTGLMQAKTNSGVLTRAHKSPLTRKHCDEIKLEVSACVMSDLAGATIERREKLGFPFFKNNKIWGNNTTMGALLCYLACIMLQRSPACRGLQCPRSQFSSNKEIFLDPVKE